MIDEHLLTRALTEAATAYDEPPGGRDAIVAALDARPASRATSTPRARIWRRPLPIAIAAGLVGLVSIGALYTGSREPNAAVTPAAPVSRDGRLSERKSGGDGAARATPPRPAPPVPAPAGVAITAPDVGGGANSAGTVDADGPPPAAEPGPGAPQPQPGQPSLAKVVKTGAVEIAVDEGRVAATLARLETLVASTRGFVAQSKTQEFGDAPSGVVTMRVPSTSYEPVLGQIRQLGEVRTASSNGQDVTAEFVDNEARLRTLRRTLGVYETLLARARSIGEVLAVQQQINGAQTQIEQLEGRLKVLNDQVSYATLTVTVVEESSAADIAVVEDPSRLRSAFDRAKDNFGDGLEWLIAASGTVALLALCVVVITALGFVLRRVLRRRLV